MEPYKVKNQKPLPRLWSLTMFYTVLIFLHRIAYRLATVCFFSASGKLAWTGYAIVSSLISEVIISVGITKVCV